jgi:hypothetical protein
MLDGNACANVPFEVDRYHVPLGNLDIDTFGD